MLHISIWGSKLSLGVLSGDGTGILGPLWQRGPPNWGYGVRLIQLWSSAAKQLIERTDSKHKEES